MDDPQATTVSLASSLGAMGTQVVTVPGTGNGGSLTIGVGIQDEVAGWRWNLGYDADVSVTGSGDLTHRLAAGASFRF